MPSFIASAKDVMFSVQFVCLIVADHPQFSDESSRVFILCELVLAVAQFKDGKNSHALTLGQISQVSRFNPQISLTFDSLPCFADFFFFTIWPIQYTDI